MSMFRSIAKRKKDDEKAKYIVQFDDEKYVKELYEFVKMAFSDLPETDDREELEEKKV